MFYSSQILARKGPLGIVWIAAHMDGQLKRNQVFEMSIPGTVEALLSPEAPLALRLTGQLLLGVVRIYAYKVNYLQQDCNDALVKIRLAYRYIQPHGDGATAAEAAVTLPDDAAMLMDANDEAAMLLLGEGMASYTTSMHMAGRATDSEGAFDMIEVDVLGLGSQGDTGHRLMRRTSTTAAGGNEALLGALLNKSGTGTSGGALLRQQQQQPLADDEMFGPAVGDMPYDLDEIEVEQLRAAPASEVQGPERATDILAGLMGMPGASGGAGSMGGGGLSFPGAARDTPQGGRPRSSARVEDDSPGESGAAEAGRPAAWQRRAAADAARTDSDAGAGSAIRQQQQQRVPEDGDGLGGHPGDDDGLGADLMDMDIPEFDLGSSGAATPASLAAAGAHAGTPGSVRQQEQGAQPGPETSPVAAMQILPSRSQSPAAAAAPSGDSQPAGTFAPPPPSPLQLQQSGQGAEGPGDPTVNRPVLTPLTLSPAAPPATATAAAASGHQQPKQKRHPLPPRPPATAAAAAAAKPRLAILRRPAVVDAASSGTQMSARDMRALLNDRSSLLRRPRPAAAAAAAPPPHAGPRGAGSVAQQLQLLYDAATGALPPSQALESAAAGCPEDDEPLPPWSAGRHSGGSSLGGFGSRQGASPAPSTRRAGMAGMAPSPPAAVPASAAEAADARERSPSVSGRQPGSVPVTQHSPLPHSAPRGDAPASMGGTSAPRSTVLDMDMDMDLDIRAGHPGPPSGSQRLLGAISTEQGPCWEERMDNDTLQEENQDPIDAAPSRCVSDAGASAGGTPGAATDSPLRKRQRTSIALTPGRSPLADLTGRQQLLPPPSGVRALFQGGDAKLGAVGVLQEDPLAGLSPGLPQSPAGSRGQGGGAGAPSPGWQAAAGPSPCDSGLGLGSQLKSRPIGGPRDAGLGANTAQSPWGGLRAAAPRFSEGEDEELSGGLWQTSSSGSQPPCSALTQRAGAVLFKVATAALSQLPPDVLCLATGFQSQAGEEMVLSQEATQQLCQASMSMRVLTQGSSRLQACRWFSELLALKSHGLVQLTQEQAYEDFSVAVTPAGIEACMPQLTALALSQQSQTSQLP